MHVASVSKSWLAAFGVLAAACSGAAPSTAASQPAQAPIPFLLQYAGEYDGAGHLQQLVVHVDGTFDAMVDGTATHGVYDGPSVPGNASLALQTADGRALTASFQVTAPAAGAPPQVQAAVALEGGTSEALVSLWVASNEGMCSATRGTWRDDDPDPITGLLCVCERGDVYLPSRGGCVAPRSAGDPPRLPVSYGAQRRAGSFDGSGRVAWIDLAKDGTFRAKIDGQIEQGAWWDATYAASATADAGIAIACTSSTRAFAATLGDDGSLTARLAAGDRETLDRR